ncbi:MAG TPA: NAD(P)/FAD-dependent oxidoreductase [Flavipsychrobacter sp.]|nr:NAD(P)/FAD-dependent oxidoreductase [Flavipsychrobacter sp.]
MQYSSSSYDVVVIGSGLGGLLSAVIMAKEGMKVCVLEKNKQLGGCLQTFSLQKQVFDSCVHYVGGLGEGHTLHRIFSYAGIMDKLELKSFDPDGFDRIVFDREDTSYPLAIGGANFVEQLRAYFPGEKQALENYITLLKKVGDHFPLYRLRKGDAHEKSSVSGWELTSTLESITTNKLLQNVLSGNNLLYAGVKNKTPFYLHALVSESYIHSAHKIIPGSSQVSKFLANELRAYGGEIFRNTEVIKLTEEQGLLRYAETADGQQFYGKQFIANMHPQVLLEILHTNLIRPAYKNRISSLQQTIAPFMLNLVLQPAAVPMRHHNIYWHRSHDSLAAVHYSAANFPETYAAYFTESKEHKGFAESISILTYMYYDEVKPWEQTHNHTGAKQERGESYGEFKQQKSEQLLQKVLQQVPELQGTILARSAATPLTFRDYTATPSGSLYGILKDVQNSAATTVAVKTKIPNLLFTGQNVNMHGVLGVSITALATCAELIGMDYLLAKVNRDHLIS